MQLVKSISAPGHAGTRLQSATSSAAWVQYRSCRCDTRGEAGPAVCEEGRQALQVANSIRLTYCSPANAPT
ncbi:hypothetical protein HC766_09355 [Candidatus Gracilibacteria bacterium]|nr:hypothetical protein [Candidatus Gracilibacteria bacterium]